MKTPTSRTRDAFRRVTVITTVLAVAACGGGSDGTSSEAVTKSEGVQSFAGTVSCDSVGGTPQSRAFETRVILDRPVHRGMGAEVSGAAAVQVGGLAGSVVTDARSRIAATIPASSLFAGVAAPAIDFAVTASPATGTYTETGRWTVDVDANGKATLKGDSTAVLEPVANGWRAACRWNLAEAQAPSGPVSYGHIESRYGTPPTLPPVAKAGPASPVPKASDGGCGEKWGLVSDGIFVVAAIVAVPTGGAALAVVLTTDALVAGGASDAAGSACLDSQLAAMNQQSAAQAIQIQSIDNYLGTATNAVFAKFSQLEAQNAKTKETIFEEFVQTISPAGSAPGLYGSFLNTSNGLGLWTDALNAAPGAPTDPMQLAVIDTAYSNAILQVGPNSSRFANALRQLSGTDVIIPSGSTCSPDPSVCVVQLHDSALISLYQSMFEALQAKIDEMVPPAHTFGSQTNQGNIVPLYDQYNAMLVKYWTQAVYAMQQAFQMEWMVNQMNYFRATSTTATKLAPIGSWGALPGTHYKYGSQSLDVETKAYNTAQKNLAKAYAARINQLYLNTLNYVVSDVPVPPQAYPNTPVSYTFNGTLYRGKPVDYGQQVGKGIPATPPGVQGPRPLNVLPAYGVWQRSAVLYQFSGLKDVAACLTNLQAYTAGTLDGTVQDWLRSPDACPSILKATDGSAPNQGYYDGNTLSPYYSNLTFVYEPTTLVLTGKMVNNLKFCDPNNPASMYWYRPSGAAVSAGNPAGLVAGAIYLNCGSWYQPTFSASAACGFPRANCPANNNSLNGNLYDIEINRQWQGVPHDKWPDKRQSWNNSNYVLLTSLQGWSYTLGQGCSSAVVSSSMPQSPTLDGYARFEPGDYNLNSNAGCTLGIFADASWGSDFPPWDKARIEKFGIRLKNADGRNGFNVPVRITAGLFDCGVFCAAEVGAELSVLRQGSIQDDGFTCVQSDPNYLAPIRCTILDGSQYDLQLVRGEDPSSSKDFTLVLKMTLK